MVNESTKINRRELKENMELWTALDWLPKQLLTGPELEKFNQLRNKIMDDIKDLINSAN